MYFWPGAKAGKVTQILMGKLMGLLRLWLEVGSDSNLLEEVQEEFLVEFQKGHGKEETLNLTTSVLQLQEYSDRGVIVDTHKIGLTRPVSQPDYLILQPDVVSHSNPRRFQT